MRFVPIHNRNVFSVIFDNQENDEFHEAFKLWRDLDYLSEYFARNFELLNTSFWKEAGLSTENIDDALDWVTTDALNLRQLIYKLSLNSKNGILPDLDRYFEPLDGQYSFVTSLIPSKGYGVFRPSMIRLYAIKLDSNCYLVIHGGIKLTAIIADTPELNEVLFRKIDSVLEYFKRNGISDVDDLIE
ncbi:MAG: hypothetical protein LIP09_05700 [Bacteroidales bacterium]|nr:hypothetical protein [Bacteroidales bacterium]